MDTEATDGEEWVLQAVTADSTRIPILRVQREPALTEHSEKLVEAQVNCGSPCTYSYFVDLAADTVSQAFEFVMSVNVKRRVVAVAEKDVIALYYIFESERRLQQIDRNFAPVAALSMAVEEIYFTSDGDLYISYLYGNNYSSKKDTISVSYKHRKSKIKK